MAGERILVVDDEEGIRRLLVRLCSLEGYQVETAADKASAFQALESGFFNICIADLRLPDANGIEVLRYAKRLYPDCEVIILTGYGDLQTAIEALRLGAYDYLQKPIFDLQLILIVIGRALERQRLAQHNSRLLADLQAANRELEFRRRQQLQYIHYIGRALSGALDCQEVAQVLVQGLLEATGCDGSGVLLLARDGVDSPVALTGSRRPLGPTAQRALLRAMLQAVPEAWRPKEDAVVLQTLMEPTTSPLDEEPWQQQQVGLLMVREDLHGVAVMASHEAQSLSEEAKSFFEILISQGAIALANARLFARANELATRDGLTGVYNHRHFFELLEAEINRAERHNQELAVIMLDIDGGYGTGLKFVNDTYGHPAGDELLRQVAETLITHVRRSDVVARYGGDEFAILAPQTGEREAYILAARICQKFMETTFTIAGHETRVTFSVGVGVFRPGQGQTATGVVSVADRGLYLAKEQGGNRVCLVGQEMYRSGS